MAETVFDLSTIELWHIVKLLRDHRKVNQRTQTLNIIGLVQNYQALK